LCRIKIHLYLNPVLISSIFIIILLIVLKVPYSDYNKGGAGIAPIVVKYGKIKSDIKTISLRVDTNC